MSLSNATLFRVCLITAVGIVALTFLPWVARAPSDLITFDGNRGPSADLAMAAAAAAGLLSIVALRLRDRSLMLPSLISGAALAMFGAAVSDLRVDFTYTGGLCGWLGCPPSLWEQPLRHTDGAPTIFAWTAVLMSGLAALAGGLVLSRRLNERMDLRNTEVTESWV